MIMYILIFISKIIENTLGTLRMIVVANGRKILGAILQLIIAFVWILSTGLVVVDIIKDPIRVVFFCLGALTGSYLGSIIEEKIALGSNMITCIVDKDSNLEKHIRNKGYAVTVVEGSGIDNKKNILFIMIKRKELYKITHIIKNFNKNTMIISEVAKTINGGYEN